MACSSSPWPTSVDTPPKPPSRMPAVTALRAEMTKQAMRVRSTRTPASSAARGLSPTANTRRPNTVPCSPHQASAATTTRTMTESGSCPMTGHVAEHEAAEGAEIVRQIAARRAARPHHGDAVDRQQHAERRDDRGHLEVGHRDAVDQADREPHGVEGRDGGPGQRRIAAGHHRGAEHAERDERADRQVEAAGHDHEDLARRPGSPAAPRGAGNS